MAGTAWRAPPLARCRCESLPNPRTCRHFLRRYFRRALVYAQDMLASRAAQVGMKGVGLLSAVSRHTAKGSVSVGVKPSLWRSRMLSDASECCDFFCTRARVVFGGSHICLHTTADGIIELRLMSRLVSFLVQCPIAPVRARAFAVLQSYLDAFNKNSRRVFMAACPSLFDPRVLMLMRRSVSWCVRVPRFHLLASMITVRLFAAALACASSYSRWSILCCRHAHTTV